MPMNRFLNATVTDVSLMTHRCRHSAGQDLITDIFLRKLMTILKRTINSIVCRNMPLDYLQLKYSADVCIAT